MLSLIDTLTHLSIKVIGVHQQSEQGRPMVESESHLAAQQPISYAVPIPAIKWILHNDCTSNVHLSTLANVCKTWRDICCNAVVVEAISSAGLDIPDTALVGSEGSLAVVKELQVHDRNNLPCLTLTPDSTLRGLYLTDMARELLVRQGSILKPDTEQSSSTDGNFCLAWFAPSGIQITAVSLDDEEDDDSQESDGFQFNFACVPKEVKVQKKQQKLKRQSSNPSVSCCKEWRGYRHATEVLTPFGYATSFLRVRCPN